VYLLIFLLVECRNSRVEEEEKEKKKTSESSEEKIYMIEMTPLEIA